MTNEEARKQSGRDMERNRQQSGRDMEESRRASGRKMRDDMRALAENNRLERKLPVLAPRGATAAKRGNASWTGGVATSGGGGIDSPLTETDGTRIYYDEVKMTVSNTFLEAFEIRMLKTLVMTDRGGTPVVLNFSDVVTDEP